MRAQLITCICPVEFQENLNIEYEAIIRNGWDILDTKFSTTTKEDEYIKYSAVIIYNEQKS